MSCALIWIKKRNTHIFVIIKLYSRLYRYYQLIQNLRHHTLCNASPAQSLCRSEIYRCTDFPIHGSEKSAQQFISDPILAIGSDLNCSVRWPFNFNPLLLSTELGHPLLRGMYTCCTMYLNGTMPIIVGITLKMTDVMISSEPSILLVQ